MFTKSPYAGIAGQQAAANYDAQTQAGAANAISPPRTIQSAIGRVDSLNERLAKMRDHLANLSDQIRGPRPANADPKTNLPSAGAVGRLNDTVDAAHDQVSDIEELLGCIARALG